MKRMWAASVLFVVAIAQPGLADSPEESRFRAEYEAAGRRWSEMFGTLHGRCTISAKTIEGQSDPTETAVFSAGHGFYKVAMTSSAKKPDRAPANEQVYCFSEDRAFSLTRAQGTRDYRVTRAGKDAHVFDDYTRRFGRLLLAPYCVQGTSISAFMQMDDFRILSVEKDATDPSLIVVGFEYRQQDIPFHVDATFDPEMSWAIRHAEHYNVETAIVRLRMDVAYGKTLVEGLPVPTSISMRDFDGRNILCTVEDAHQAATPREEFAMSHYGLPNLDEPVQKPRVSPSFVWVGVAVLGLVVAWILRIVSRRM